MHLVVVYGFQGASDDSEKLGLTGELFDAVLGELSVIGRGQPCVIAGDFNMEPTKVPCLLKVISAGLWVDLQGAWASASGVSRPFFPHVTSRRILLQHHSILVSSPRPFFPFSAVSPRHNAAGLTGLSKAA